MYEFSIRNQFCTLNFHSMNSITCQCEHFARRSFWNYRKYQIYLIEVCILHTNKTVPVSLSTTHSSIPQHSWTNCFLSENVTNYVFQLQFKNWRMAPKILFQNWNFVFLLFVEHFLPYKLSLEKFTYFTPNMFKRSLYLSNKAVVWKVHTMFLFTFLKKLEILSWLILRICIFGT